MSLGIEKTSLIDIGFTAFGLLAFGLLIISLIRKFERRFRHWYYIYNQKMDLLQVKNNLIHLFHINWYILQNIKWLWFF